MITNYLMNDYMYIAADYYFYSICDNNLHFILLYLYLDVNLILSMIYNDIYNLKFSVSYLDEVI